MKSIYVFLTRSNTILSRIVYFITKDPYTHASISFDENLQVLYSSARKNGRTIFPAGPCREYLCGGYYKRHSQIPCAVYELKVNDDVYEKAMQEVDKIMVEAGKYHFNIIGLILCRFHIPHHRKYYLFCSQFVSEVLKRSQAVKLPKDTSLMRPMDYTTMPELIFRYEGHIYELACQEQLSFG